MDDTEQTRRERAYKIWEDEGRLDGHHEDHWQRADAQDERTQQESADVTEANQQADDEFAKAGSKAGSASANSTPSIVSPD